VLKSFTPPSVNSQAAQHVIRGVRDAIERHIDKQQIDLLKVAETSERELLTKWATTLKGAAS